MPHLATLAARGEVGRAATIPAGMPPGSDVGNLSILGYDPALYHTGRAPIEAAAMGLRLRPDQVAYRCNLVTVGDDGTMVDFAGGHPTTEAAAAVIATLQAGAGRRRGHVPPRRAVPPHPRRPRHVGRRRLHPAPRPHRQARGLAHRPRRPPAAGAHGRVPGRSSAASDLDANQIWLWGQGRQPVLPSFESTYGLTAGLVTAVDLVRGLGVLTGIPASDVEGITGWYDTNYEGKRDACLEALADGDDLFLIHVEASDEAGHAGNVEAKVEALENWDRRIIGPLVEGLDDLGPWRLLLLPDHATPLALRTHTSDSVPYLLVDSAVDGPGGIYTEAGTASAPPVPGHPLMSRLVGHDPRRPTDPRAADGPGVTRSPERTPMRTLVLVDGEHYPPVVRAAIEDLPGRVPGAVVVGAALLGGGEKLAAGLPPDLGWACRSCGATARTTPLAAGLAPVRPRPGRRPVRRARARRPPAACAWPPAPWLAGVPYQGADFRFDPPPRPRLATKPSVAVIGTGKRTGKTAVSAHLARLLAERGTPPVVVAMGRGGPPEPELVDPATLRPLGRRAAWPWPPRAATPPATTWRTP